MLLSSIVAAIGVVLAITYLALGTVSFLRIRRELSLGNPVATAFEAQDGDSAEEVSVVPGFGWKASIAVATSFVLLVVASFSGQFWYVLAVSGLGTAVAVIVAFVLELRSDRLRTLVP
ncbi:hypothetical protein [Mycolicibacterium sp. XJ1819]